MGKGDVVSCRLDLIDMTTPPVGEVSLSSSSSSLSSLSDAQRVLLSSGVPRSGIPIAINDFAR